MGLILATLISKYIKRKANKEKHKANKPYIESKISIYWTSFLARGPFRGSTQKWRVFCWGVWPLWRKIDPILQCCLFSLCMLEWPCCPRLQFQREWALMCLLFIDKPLHLLLYLHLLSLTGSKELYFTLYTQPLLILTISMLKKY